MAIVQWDGTLATGVESIDVQHKELFRIINSMDEKLKKGFSDHAFVEGMDSLRGYIKYHFRTEESYMEMYGYPELAAHRQDHMHFVNQIEELAADLAQPTQQKTERLLSFLLSWLIQHIQGRDLLLGPFLRDFLSDGQPGK